MEEGTASAWNFDQAQFYSIKQIKDRFVECILEWNLEGAYWAVRTLRMEIDAKLKRKETNKLLAKLEEEKATRKNTRVVTEKEQIDSMMDEVDEARSEFLKNYNPSNTDKSKFYLILESFYMHLCHTMKKHKMFYREGEDNRLAILRR